MPFINKSEATKRSGDRKENGKCTNATNCRSRVGLSTSFYQLREGKSQNSTVAIHINGILISLHLDTQADVTVVTEKHYGKLRVNCPLQQTSVAIRSYSGEGKGTVLPVLGKFTATLVRGEKEIADPVYVVQGQGDTVLLSRGVR